MDAVESDIVVLQGEMDSAESDIAILSGEMDAVESDIVVIKSDLLLTANGSDVVTATSDIVVLQGEMDAVESDIVVIKSDLLLTANGSDVVTATSDIVVIKSDLLLLMNDSMQDDKHRHSELSASDGDPNPALSIDADGNMSLLATKKLYLDGGGNTYIYEFASDDLRTFVGGTQVMQQTAADCKVQNVNLIVGDTTNYTQIATDGEITLAGTARVKKEFTVPLSDFNPGASGPTGALQGIFPSYEFGIGDDMHTSFEVPTDCDTSEDITIEIYWGINEDYATNSGEVQWSAGWRAVAVGEELTAGGSSGTVDFGDVNIPASANTLIKTEGTIAAASLSQDDLVALNGARVALDGGSNPSAEPYVVMVNIEYYVNKIGEAT